MPNTRATAAVHSRLMAALPRVLGIALLVVLGARVFVNGVAEHLARSQPQQALDWRSGQPEALLHAAVQSVDAGEADAARALARRAVAANPLDGRGYGALARVMAADADPARQHLLMEQAVRRAPRDLGNRAWLLQHDLAEGRFGAALGQVDAMLRVRPALGKTLYPALAALVDDPQARPALTDLLARAPRWRPAFWSRLCRDGGPTEAIATLVQALDTGAAPLQPGERADWLERLIRDRHWAQAYPLWAATLPPEQRTHLANVYDGAFEHTPENGGFGWRIERVAGADIALRGAPGARSLHIRFAGQRVAFRHVRQLLALSPGAYRLQGRVRTDALRNERGLQWSVTCAEGRGERIAATDRYAGSSPWRDFAVDFTVPEACGAQWLRLDLAARVPGERQVSGSIEFAGLRIARSEPRASAPH